MATIRSTLRRLQIHFQGKSFRKALPSSTNFSISLFFIVALILVFFIAITISSVTSQYPDVISVIIIIIVISVLIFSLVLQPILRLISEMRKVSELDFSVLDGKYKYSPIKEVRNVQNIFIRLVSTMKAYKAFVPASLFEKDDDDDDEDTSNELGSNYLSLTLGNSSESPTNTTPSTYSPNAKKKAKAAGWLQKKLQASGKRMAVVLVVNIDNYNTLMTKVTTRDLVTVHQKFVNAIVNCVREQHGVVDGFTADKIEATWGGMKKYTENVHPSEAACNAALSIQTTIKNLNVDLERQGFPSISVRIGLDKGFVVLGVFGPLSMKMKSCQGTPFTIAHKLEQLNKRIGSNVLVSQRVYDDIEKSDKFRLRPVDILRSKEIDEENKHKMVVYQLQDGKSLLKESWMHAFEQNEIKEFHQLYEAAFECFQHGDHKRCIKLLNDLHKKMNFEDPPSDSLMKRAKLMLILKENIPSLNLSDLDIARLMD